ncbi:MAG: ATP-binding cassette domain-containing protein [Campylobacter sp.]|nr:ATP-binding cassette domain-containing protein [Campylobacter sp.]
MSENLIIQGIDVSTSYSGRVMHDKVSWSVKEGEIYGFLGGSGSGKTTLLKTMLYLKEPDEGKILFDGVDMWAANSEQKAQIKQKSSVMFQFGALYTAMNVLDNVGVLLSEYSSFSKRQIDEISMFWIQKVGLKPDVATLYPSELSGGMKKRVALARALALSPKLLFLDEPNSGLDPMSSRAMDELVQNLRETLGISVIMVTHDIDSIFDILDRFLIIENQKIAFEGSLGELEKAEYNPLEELFKTRKR